MRFTEAERERARAERRKRKLCFVMHPEPQFLEDDRSSGSRANVFNVTELTMHLK